MNAFQVMFRVMTTVVLVMFVFGPPRTGVGQVLPMNAFQVMFRVMLMLMLILILS